MLRRKKEWQRDLSILKRYSISLREWEGDGLTEKGYLAEASMKAIEELISGSPYSSIVPLFSMDSLKFVIAPLRVKPRVVSLNTPFPGVKFSFLWPLERVFDLEGREILSGKMPYEFLFINGRYPAHSLLGLYYEINLPFYWGAVEEKVTFWWLSENDMPIRSGLKLLREQAIKDSAFQVVFDLEAHEIVRKVNRRHPWHTEPRKFLEALYSLEDDFVFADIALSEEEG